MAMGQSFYEVLTAAVDDLAEHGFDSLERLERWTAELRLAAGAVTANPAELERMLREGLASVYKRLVDKGGIARMHPGVGRFTLEQVKPKLRAELDRRIMSSASLIRLNREQAIDKTIQRFQGWATSIPIGGSAEPEKVKTKKNVRKSLAQLPFEERRVLIDQGHKLTASLSNILATDGGAIAAKWRSHWRQAGYNYRKDHKERDEKVYALRESWAMNRGLMKKGPNPYYDDITQAAEEPFCFPGTSKQRAAGVEAAYRRFYEGEICTVTFDDGTTLQATPNHPVITSGRGWIPVGSLNDTDHVFQVGDKTFGSSEHNDDDRIPTAAEIFASVNELGVSEVRGGQLEQFHGDGSEGDVDIVWADRPLSFGLGKTSREHRFKKLRLAMSLLSRSAVGSLKLFAVSCLRTATSFMGGGGEPLTSAGPLFPHSDAVGVAATANGTAGLSDDVADYLSRHLELSGQSKDACSALVKAARVRRVIRVERSHFCGHVYNLQTENGWYVADSIIVHNCRCYIVWIYALRDLPKDMLTVKGSSALDEARAAIAAM